MSALQLDEVLFVLPEQLPHRQPRAASFNDRLAMLLLALAPHPQFALAVSSHGLFLDIARALEPHYPSRTRLCFLTGADAAERILRWEYPDREASLREMFSRFELAVAGRGSKFRMPASADLEPYAARVHPLEMPVEWREVSATRVREACRRGEPFESLVPPAVAAYIRDKGLYRD